MRPRAAWPGQIRDWMTSLRRDAAALSGGARADRPARPHVARLARRGRGADPDPRARRAARREARAHAPVAHRDDDRAGVAGGVAVAARAAARRTRGAAARCRPEGRALLAPLLAQLGGDRRRRDVRVRRRPDDRGAGRSSPRDADRGGSAMQPIIDVDAHFEPGNDWLDPYPELAARLPRLDPSLLAVDAIVGDLLRDVPRRSVRRSSSSCRRGCSCCSGRRRPPRPSAGRSSRARASSRSRTRRRASRGSTSRASDLQNVICLSGFAYVLLLDDVALRQETLATCNTLARRHLRRGARPPAAGDRARLHRPRLGRRRADAHARARQPHLPDPGIPGERRTPEPPELGSRVVGRDRHSA